MHANWHGRKVRVEGSTTHPAQIRLLFDLFYRYSKPMIYSVQNPPYFREWSRYAWRAVFNLDETFGFLISFQRRMNDNELKNDKLFYSALGGFADAEGCISLSGHGRERSAPRLSLSNTNSKLCGDFLEGLRRRGVSCSLGKTRRNIGQIQYQLSVSSRDTLPVIERLNLRHEEKIAARNLVGRLNGIPWVHARLKYKEFRRKIRLGRNVCALAAKSEYLNRDKMKLIRIQVEQEITRRAISLYDAGLRPQYIATLLGRSQRTIYRRVATGNNPIQVRREETEQVNHREEPIFTQARLQPG